MRCITDVMFALGVLVMTCTMVDLRLVAVFFGRSVRAGRCNPTGVRLQA
jgi:hypothetical protein